jgi:hypothetical protein
MNRFVELSPANHRIVSTATPTQKIYEIDVHLQQPVIRITSIGTDDHGLNVVKTCTRADSTVAVPRAVSYCDGAMRFRPRTPPAMYVTE